MDIDDFAPNLSFFFSNGMDAEYSVIGRVARRIWAVAMKERYGAGERSQKLKYHVQTSGRSLHAQEMDFNDIRTTLQALCAIYDNANSLHTNAYDEAVTTPSEQSVRRALAIQMIIDKEWGLAGNENPLQGSFVIEELTDLVEEAVLAEFDRIAERGGVLGRDGDRLPARPDPGRVDALRAPQARRQPADRRRQHLPRAADRRRRPAPRWSWPARPRPRSSRSWTGSPTSTRATPTEAPAALARLQQVAMERRQRLRRADGGRPRAARSARSPRRSSRSAASTAATSEGPPPSALAGSGRCLEGADIATSHAGRPRDHARHCPFDPIEEAARLWREHGWADAADGMAAVTSLMRAQAIVQARVDDVLRPLQLSFARYELLMLLSFTRQGCLPMAKAGARLQVHPASVTNAATRLEAAGLVVRRPHPEDGRARARRDHRCRPRRGRRRPPSGSTGRCSAARR